jgi:hypothetical protein
MQTFGLSSVIAVGTLVVMYLTSLAWFTGAGIIFPTIVAWVAGALFAAERRPRHLWLHVAAIGIVVGSLINFYPYVVRRMSPPPPGYAPGGPNMNPPGLTPLPPPPR